MENEIFVPIRFCETHAISNYGRVKILKHRFKGMIGRIRKPRMGGSNKKYERTSILGKDYYIHRLVLEHFSTGSSVGMEASHLDGNSRNNHISNLKWETPLENNARRKGHGTNGSGSKNAMAKLTDSEVIEIRRPYSIGVHINIIRKKYNGRLSAAISGITWRHLVIDPETKSKIEYWSKHWIRTSNERNKNRFTKARKLNPVSE